jgi:hypothetical protein
VVERERPTAAPSDEDPVAEHPEVVDLRGHEASAGADDDLSVGAKEQAAGEAGPAPSTGSLTANEGWGWASLSQEISDAQHQARWPSGVARRAADTKARQPATGRLTPEDWAIWVDLGHKISPRQTDSVSKATNGAEIDAPDQAAAPEPAPAADLLAHVGQARLPAARQEPAVTAGPPPSIAAAPSDPAPVLEPSGAASVGSPGRRAAIISLAALGLVVLLVLVLGTLPGRRPAPSGETETQVLNAATVLWLDGNVAPGARVLAPPRLVPQLRSGLPRRTIIAYDDAAEQPADLVIVSTDLEQLPADAAARRTSGRAVPVAVLAAGSVELREVVSKREAASNTATARRRAGRELVRRLALRLTPAAWSELINGKVDARLMTMLGRLADRHTLDIADFPTDPSSQKVHAPARTTVLTAIDGSPVGLDGGATATKNAARKSAFGEVPAITAVRQLAGKPSLVLRYLLPAHAS